MYIPPHFELDEVRALEFIKANSFACLVAQTETGLEAVHLPVLLRRAEPLTLFGHVARANPIWKAFTGEQPALVIFSGPHAYISPNLYVNHPSVPTWNYVVVHASGNPRIIDDSAEVIEGLLLMTSTFDPDLKDSHPEGLETEYLTAMSKGIVAFELKIDKIEGKAKLSQNRSEEERARVLLAHPEISEIAGFEGPQV